MKKILTKKWFLTLGMPLVIAPLAVAASCTDTVESLTSDEIETNGQLANAKNVVELEYQEKLIKAINSGFDNTSYQTIFSSQIRNGTSSVAMKDLVKYYINQQVFTNREYLKSYGQSLLKEAQNVLIVTASGQAPTADNQGNYSKITYADVNRYRLLDEVPTNGTPWIAEPAQAALFDELVQQVIKGNIGDIKNQIYRFIIGYNYLDSTKTEWDSVYHKNSDDKTYREYSLTDVEIDDATFVLTKEVIKNKAFFTWTASLTEDESKAFINLKALTLKQADDLMDKSNTTTDRLPLGYSSFNKTVPNYLKNILDQTSIGDAAQTTNLSNLVNYQGLQKRTAVGYKSLSFSTSELRGVTSNTKYNEAYNGYVFDNELRRSNIELFATGSKIVSLTRVAGVMPQYVNAKFNVNQFDRSALKSMMFFLNATDIYDEAITYYTSQSNPIKLKIVDTYLRKLAIDTFGFTFVEKE